MPRQTKRKKRRRNKKTKKIKLIKPKCSPKKKGDVLPYTC